MTEHARPFLPMLSLDEVDEQTRHDLAAATRKGYQDPNFLRGLANAPDLLRHLLSYTKAYMYGGEIEHRLIELIRLKIAQLNACHF